MKKILMCLIGIVLLSCNAGEENYFRLAGTIEGLTDSTKVYLITAVDGVSTVDSTLVVNEKFSFQGPVTYPQRASLITGHDPQYVFKDPRSAPDSKTIYIEPGRIVFFTVDSLYKGTASGTPANDDHNRWNSLSESVNNRRNELMRQYYNAFIEGSLTDDYVQQYNRSYREADSVYNALLLSFIENNRDSYYALEALFPSATDVKELDKMEHLLNGFSDRIRQTPKAAAYFKTIQQVHDTAIGSIAPDFTMDDTDGNQVKLSDLRGKYVLLDFWASWCGPCRAENPHVVKAYEAYKDKGFTILGVSLDTGRDEWVKAIDDDKLYWTNVSDLKGWKSEAGELYVVRSVPTNYLISPDGIILEKNLRGNALIETLSKYL